MENNYFQSTLFVVWIYLEKQLSSYSVLMFLAIWKFRLNVHFFENVL